MRMIEKECKWEMTRCESHAISSHLNDVIGLIEEDCFQSFEYGIDELQAYCINYQRNNKETEKASQKLEQEKTEVENE